MLQSISILKMPKIARIAHSAQTLRKLAQNNMFREVEALQQTHLKERKVLKNLALPILTAPGATCLFEERT